MYFKLAALCGFLILQGVWCNPASFSFGLGNNAGGNGGVKLGAGVSGGLNGGLSGGLSGGLGGGLKGESSLGADVKTSVSNIGVGFDSILNPLLNMGFHTVPGLIHNGLQTGAKTLGNLVEGGVKAGHLVGNGLSHVLGGSLVLGSQLAGSGMQMLGEMLKVGNGAIETGVEGGIHLGADLGKALAIGNALMGNMTSDALLSLAEALNTGSTGIQMAADGTKNVIEAVGRGMTNTMKTAENALAKMMSQGVEITKDGVLTFTSKRQEDAYRAMQNYLNIMMQLQTMMNNLSHTIDVAITDPSKTIEEGADAAIKTSAGLINNVAKSVTEVLPGLIPSISVEANVGAGGKASV